MSASSLKSAADSLNAEQLSAIEVLKKSRANELFVAVVAPAGAGAGTAARAIADFLRNRAFSGQEFEVITVKASHCIKEWAIAKDLGVPEKGPRKSLDGMVRMQDLGDQMRQS